MPTVMAFDVATHVGIAYGPAGGTPLSTTVDLGQGRTQEARFAKAIDLTRTMISRFKPDLVVYEAPIGGKHASAFLIGLAACVAGQAHLSGVKPHHVNILTVRKHFLGRHMTVGDFPGLSAPRAKLAIKQLVIDRCRLLGWKVDSDDAADACACWDYAAAKFCRAQARPLGALFNG